MEQFPQNSAELVVPDRRARLDVQSTFFDAHPELITPAHLNNLYTKLFGAAYRKQMEGHEGIVKKIHETPPQGQSPKRAQQSLEQFYAAIDEAAQEAGVSLEDSTELGDELQIARESNDRKRYEELFNEIQEKCIAIYRVLREKGYNHYDLIQ